MKKKLDQDLGEVKLVEKKWQQELGEIKKIFVSLTHNAHWCMVADSDKNSLHQELENSGAN